MAVVYIYTQNIKYLTLWNYLNDSGLRLLICAPANKLRDLILAIEMLQKKELVIAVFKTELWSQKSWTKGRSHSAPVYRSTPC